MTVKIKCDRDSFSFEKFFESVVYVEETSDFYILYFLESDLIIDRDFVDSIDLDTE